jgi:amidase
MQTAFREDKLVKYGAAIEAVFSGRPRPRFKNINANNWMYIGVPPGGKDH